MVKEREITREQIHLLAAGDEAIGKLVAIEDSGITKPETDTKVKLYTIRCSEWKLDGSPKMVDDGENRVLLGTVMLDSLITEKMIGLSIRIVYEGTEDLSGGRKMKVMRLFIRED